MPKRMAAPDSEKEEKNRTSKPLDKDRNSPVHEEMDAAGPMPARINPSALTPTAVLSLQRTLGNQATGQILQGGTIQRGFMGKIKKALGFGKKKGTDPFAPGDEVRQIDAASKKALEALWPPSGWGEVWDVIAHSILQAARTVEIQEEIEAQMGRKLHNYSLENIPPDWKPTVELLKKVQARDRQPDELMDKIIARLRELGSLRS